MYATVCMHVYLCICMFDMYSTVDMLTEAVWRAKWQRPGTVELIHIHTHVQSGMHLRIVMLVRARVHSLKGAACQWLA
jgi:hypothetical protein